MTTRPTLYFAQLNRGWNAEPNAPDVTITAAEESVIVEFDANAFLYPQYREGERLHLEFLRIERYRFGETNDEGWAMGKCRFGHAAPRWGEFYEVSGDIDELPDPGDWKVLGRASKVGRHFLFYFRDDTFECVASEWRLVRGSHVEG